MIKVRRLCFIFTLLFSVIGCDQVSKRVFSDTLKVTGPLTYLKSTVRLEAAQNQGAFLNLGAGWSAPVRFWFFNIATLMMMFLAWLVFRGRQTSAVKIAALTLILGGGIGNLIDRFA